VVSNLIRKGFFAAVAASDVPSVNAFLTAGIDPNVHDSRDGRTAVYFGLRHMAMFPVVKAL
jgi:hypothetical protein